MFRFVEKDFYHTTCKNSQLTLLGTNKIYFKMFHANGPAWLRSDTYQFYALYESRTLATKGSLLICYGLFFLSLRQSKLLVVVDLKYRKLKRNTL